MRASPRVNWFISNVKGKTILDIGFCGEDFLLHNALARKNQRATFIGLDSNRGMMGKGGYAGTGVLADGYQLPFKSGAFDAVIAAEVIEHDVRPFSLFKEVSRVLCEGGRFYLSTPNPWYFYRLLRNWVFRFKPEGKDNVRQYLGDADHKSFFDPLSLANLLRMCDLEVVQLTSTNFTIPVTPEHFTFSLAFWPFNRLSGYTCLVAEKRVPT